MSQKEPFCMSFNMSDICCLQSLTLVVVAATAEIILLLILPELNRKRIRSFG